jgi:tight adherence protein C
MSQSGSHGRMSRSRMSASRSHGSSSRAVVIDEKERKDVGDRIVQAGFYKRGFVWFFYVARVGLAILPVLVGLGAANLGHVTVTMGLIYGILAGAIGSVAPSFWLDYKKRVRQTKLRRALPDALDIIIVCVEAGLSLPAALQRVSKELRQAHPLLAGEMAICQREIQMGCSAGEALHQLSERFDLEELRSLASVIQQAERFGASIVNALRVHAETLRIKRFQRAEELAAQAVVKLVFPTILCIFPSLFIVLAGPAVFRIFQMFDKMAS